MKKISAACALVILVGGVVARWGRGETTEFSPIGLCYRDVDVWYVSLVNIPVFARVKTTWPHPLRDLWTEHGGWTATEPAHDWERVRWWTPGSPATTTLIADLTDAKSVNFPAYWQAWTAAHPTEADNFWPVVIDHVRSRRYKEAVAQMGRHAWGDAR